MRNLTTLFGATIIFFCLSVFIPVSLGKTTVTKQNDAVATIQLGEPTINNVEDIQEYLLEVGAR